MRRGLAAAVLGGGATALAAAVMLAAPGGQGQDRPGQIGQAKVWIENHGRAEAVPIVLEEVTAAAPINVQVSGRRPWRSRASSRLALPASSGNIGRSRSSLVRMLRWRCPALGADGWEATSIQLPAAPGNSVIVLKRPR